MSASGYLSKGTTRIEKKFPKPLLDEYQIRELVAEYVRGQVPRSEGGILRMGDAGEGNKGVVDVEKAADEFLWRLGDQWDRVEGVEGRPGVI